MKDHRVLRYLLPVGEEMTKAVTDLWRDCFGEHEVTGTREQFAGAETDVNEDHLYMLTVDGRLASTCHVSRKKGTAMAALGGVATVPEFRGMGFGRDVCSRALEDFDAEGGEIIWLGTVNPVAADLYHRLGFSFLPGTSVMRRMRKGLTDTHFFDEFFKGDRAVVKNGSAACRISMIPLLTGRWGFTVMDSLTRSCGPETIVGTSCTGLYSAYEAVRKESGNWCFLDSGAGRIGGLGSWKARGDGTALADGFWHPNYRSHAPALFRALMDEARAAGCRVVLPVADADEAKVELAVELGGVRGPERLWQARRGIIVPMHDYLV